MAASSSSHKSPKKYDVFLSFKVEDDNNRKGLTSSFYNALRTKSKGEDRRNNGSFTTSLYNALRAKGVQIFMDSKRGAEFSLEPLTEALEGAKIAVIVFSKEYASSKWCLNELVKVLECRDRCGQKVFPVFYNVDPSHVRKQEGLVDDALAKAMEKATMEEATRWTVALRFLGQTRGHTIPEDDRRPEEKVMNEIVEEIQKLLRGQSSSSDLKREESNAEKKIAADRSVEEQPPEVAAALESLLYLPSNVHVEIDYSNTIVKQLDLVDKAYLGLKKLILKNCKQLIQIGDLSMVPNLEDLDASGCTSLRQVSSSIQHLNKLVLLNFGGCKELENLPDSIASKVLEFLYLSGCTKLTKIPKVTSNIKALQVTGIPIRDIPAGFNLNHVLGCKALLILSLQDSKLTEVPEAIGELSTLVYLDLKDNKLIKTLPTTIKYLSLLRTLKLSFCESLESLPELPANIEQLDAHNCTALGTIVFVPAARLWKPENEQPSRYSVTTSNKRMFKYSNCFKLATNFGSELVEDAVIKLKKVALLEPDKLVKADYAGESNLLICVPGCDIPNWFTYRVKGPSMDVYLPQGWCDRKFMGFALCVVIGPKSSWNPGAEEEEEPTMAPTDVVSIECRLQNYYGAWYKSMLLFREGVFPMSVGNKVFQTKHVLIAYDTSMNGIVAAAGGLRTSMDQNLAMFDFVFVRSERAPVVNWEVKKCGVRLLYTDE